MREHPQLGLPQRTARGRRTNDPPHRPGPERTVGCERQHVADRVPGRRGGGIFHDLGVRELLWRVALRPGKPTWMGERDGKLHPVQAAFIEHDGFQCGFCTSGQIMSAVAMLAEAKAGWPSAATADVRRPFTVADLTGPEIRERMSGNLCRCACYPNIVDAIADAAGRG